jgi:hypothetical protein
MKKCVALEISYVQPGKLHTHACQIVCRDFVGFKVAVLELVVQKAALLEEPPGAGMTFVIPFGPLVDVFVCKIGCPCLVGKHVQIRMRCIILDQVVCFVRFFCMFRHHPLQCGLLPFFPLEVATIVVFWALSS